MTGPRRGDVARRDTSGALRERDDHTPASTALWRDGDHPGERRFVSIGRLELESGESLPDVVLAYETWGRLSPERDNAVLVEHALTGDSHVVGEAGPGHPTAGWWPGLIGQGAPLDDDYFVIAINVLGGCQGSTGPGSAAPDGRPWGSRFPRLTIRDQVAAEARLADVLGIERWHTVIGGSMGACARSSGSRATPSASARRSPWRPAVTPPRSRSGGARRRSSRSATTRGSPGVTTTTTRRAPRPGWPSPAASPTSPTAASSSCTSASTDGSRTSPPGPRAARVTRSRATSTTTAASSRAASTPTPTRCSPRR